jgi:hypothetical protein
MSSAEAMQGEERSVSLLTLTVRIATWALCHLFFHLLMQKKKKKSNPTSPHSRKVNKAVMFTALHKMHFVPKGTLINLINELMGQ